MNTFETYVVAVIVSMSFLIGAGLLVMGLRQAKRAREQWTRR